MCPPANFLETSCKNNHSCTVPFPTLQAGSKLAALKQLQLLHLHICQLLGVLLLLLLLLLLLSCTRQQPVARQEAPPASSSSSRETRLSVTAEV
jgi:hypothetical protein